MNSSATRMAFLMAMIIAALAYIHGMDAHPQAQTAKTALTKNIR